MKKQLKKNVKRYRERPSHIRDLPFDPITFEIEQALKRSLAMGMGREPTPDESLAVVDYVRTVLNETMFINLAMQGKMLLGYQDGRVTFRLNPNNAEVAGYEKKGGEEEGEIVLGDDT